MKSRKIIHVVPTFGAGGTEQNCARLARSFSSSYNYENIIVALRPGDESFRNFFHEVSATSLIVLYPSRYKRMRQFLKLVRTNNPDAVLFHFLNIDQVLLAFVSRIAGVSKIAAAAGSAAVGNLSDLFKIQIILMSNFFISCPIVSASNWIATTHRRLMFLPKGSTVVHNGVDIERFANFNIDQNLNQQSNRPWTLGMVSRLDAIKEHDVLIRGFAKFLKNEPEADAELRIIGDGPKRQELESLVSSLGVTDKILFLGNRLDIPEQISLLDVFVFATKEKEGFGNVIIEALAAGVPVIANDVPSSKEVLQGGKLGTLVPNAGDEAWAEAFKQYWRNGSSVSPPDALEIDSAYGIKQFQEGYFAALGLEAHD